jgi:[citrate (pro-3S)-lyase] ligase
MAYQEKILNLRNPYALKPLDAFLTIHGFTFDPHDVDYTMVLYDEQDKIAGTGSYQGQVLKYVVVEPSHRATNAFSVIVNHLVRLLMKRYRQIFAFTRPGNARSFMGLGFKEVATAEPLYTLLEFGYRSIHDYRNYLQSQKTANATPPISAIVANCNPFSNGHKYLIETAASQSNIVYLFVVEEDRSVFPFKDRWKLVKEGTQHLANVVMLKGGHYVVSSATFPRYFLQGETLDLVVKNQAELDVLIFSQHIVPALGITRRYMGTEPYSATTRAYNSAMKQILTQYGVEVIEVERNAMGMDAQGVPNYISATKIRAAIKEDRLASILDFLPACTRAYLQSDLSEAARAKLRKGWKPEGIHLDAEAPPSTPKGFAGNSQK